MVVVLALLVAFVHGALAGLGWWLAGGDADPVAVGLVYALGVLWAIVFWPGWRRLLDG